MPDDASERVRCRCDNSGAAPVLSWIEGGRMQMLINDGEVNGRSSKKIFKCDH